MKKLMNRVLGTVGLQLRATPENPAFNLNDPEAWDLFTDGAETDSGVRMNHRKALKIAPVWQAVSMISGSWAKLPLEVFRRLNDDGDREKATSHPAYSLVRRQPNDEMTAFKFWRTLAVHALLWNNAYAYILRSGDGTPLKLLPLLPDRTSMERHSGLLWCVTEVSRRPDGSPGPWLKAIPHEDVLHLSGISITGLEGCDQVKHAKDDYALALSKVKFESKFYKHGLRTSGVLEIPQGTGKPVRDKIEKGFRDFHENSNNWFKTIVLRDGAKFHQTSIDPQAAQMRESRDADAGEVAHWFNLQPSRLGVKGSTAYNSKSEDNQSYLDDTLSPWLEMTAQECWLKLLSQAERDADSHYLEHNVAMLLRLNALQRWQIYAIATRIGAMNANEVRRKENMPPREEGGDDYAPTGGIKPGGGGGVGGADKAPNDPAKPGQEEDPPTDPPPDPNSARRLLTENLARRSVVFTLTARARHKSKNDRAFLEWIDGNLVSHRSEALQRCGINADVELVEPLLIAFRRIADTTSADRLAAAVDEACLAAEAKV